jgi:MATE family multidrug resistance protein
MPFLLEQPQTSLRCSLKDLIKASLPMALSLLSGTFLYLLDRFLLAHYSEKTGFVSLNAAAFGHQYADLFYLPIMAFATMSEVFVGQYNGAKQRSKTSLPVFQMSLFLLVFWAVVFPLSLPFASKILPPALHAEGIPYFLINMLMLPFQIVFATCSAFFIGTRRPTIILMSVFFSLCINAVLDIFLIFGIGSIPPMGATGAALASLIASASSCGILLAFFLNKYNSHNYETRRVRFDLDVLKKNILLGLPYAICEVVEMATWLLCLWTLSNISMDFVTVHNASVALWVFFTFMLEGVQKGVVALSSNCLGANQDQFMSRLIRSSAKLALFCIIFSGIPLILLPEQTIQMGFGIKDPFLMAKLREVLIIFWLELPLVLMVNCCLAGILTSGGDTKFIMGTKMTTFLFCFIIPLLLLLHYNLLEVKSCWIMSFVQGAFSGIVLLYRYRSKKWKHALIQ